METLPQFKRALLFDVEETMERVLTDEQKGVVPVDSQSAGSVSCKNCDFYLPEIPDCLHESTRRMGRPLIIEKIKKGLIRECADSKQKPSD